MCYIIKSKVETKSMISGLQITAYTLILGADKGHFNVQIHVLAAHIFCVAYFPEITIWQNKSLG